MSRVRLERVIRCFDATTEHPEMGTRTSMQQEGGLGGPGAFAIRRAD